MSLVQDKLAEIIQAASDEHDQVMAAIGALKNQIQVLQDQINAGGDPVTAEQLEALKATVQNIFTPDEPT